MIKAKRDEILGPLSAVSGIIERRHTLPILSNVLIDRAADLDGSYYLTYHRWATRDQVERCHPRMREFLDRKRVYDPEGTFTSDWYEHHLRLLHQAPPGERS